MQCISRRLSLFIEGVREGMREEESYRGRIAAAKDCHASAVPLVPSNSFQHLLVLR